MQLSIFTTGIKCGYCNKDPGRGSNNGYVWDGFWDADMDIKVCNDCKAEHYRRKRETKFVGMYSETPVVVKEN
jgi:hypothetical protein